MKDVSLIIFLISIFLIFNVKSQISVKNTYNFPVEMENIYVTLIDSELGIAYFADQDSSRTSHLCKIRISNFKFISCLDLGVYNVYCGTIDTENKLAYFGNHRNQAEIIKVDLRSFQVVDTITLTGGISNLFSAQIDIVNQKAYFISDSTSPDVVKIDLVTFLQESTLEISDQNRWGSVIDVPKGFLYIFTDYFVDSNPTIEKIALSTFTKVDSLTLNSSERHPFTGVIDSSKGFMYVGTKTSPIQIVKVNLNDFSRVGSITSPETQYYAYASGIDEENQLAYFIAYSGYIIRINLRDFSIVDSLELGVSYFPLSLSLDLERNVSFIGAEDGGIYKLDLTSFNQQIFGEIPFFADLGVIVIDPNTQNAYIGFQSALIVKFDLDAFEMVDYIQNDNTDNMICFGAIDKKGQFGYFFTQLGLDVYKIDLSNFSVDFFKEFFGSDYINEETEAVVFDKENSIFYVGFNYFENRTIYKISVPDLEIVGSLNIGMDSIPALLLDSSKGFLYADLGFYGTSLLKIQLSNFEPVFSINLTDYGRLNSIIIDSTHEFIFFGNEMCDDLDETSKSKLSSCGIEICRISLLNGDQIECDTTNLQNGIQASFLDTSDTYAFFFSDFESKDLQISTNVTQIDTISNEILYNFSFDNFAYISISAVDPITGNAYIAPYGYPVSLIQLLLPKMK
ncbi:hypothetical protein M0811_00477 [Anaeramoeba ignava]|uniref:LVIVD repeat protein n=1 Tax=Anaeramoeba ignava TaxID=1746090 RepID=A0A9Q0REG8_ANAIG|nr:hypothetical protein M0811_00477 [Anaeramoeba ignava]